MICIIIFMISIIGCMSPSISRNLSSKSCNLLELTLFENRVIPTPENMQKSLLRATQAPGIVATLLLLGTDGQASNHFARPRRPRAAPPPTKRTKKGSWGSLGAGGL